MIGLSKSAGLISKFCGKSLKNKLSSIEDQCIGNKANGLKKISSKFEINIELINATHNLQKITSQIYIVNHAICILISLPHILEKTEKIQYLSLGAGNTGKDFDLETNHRIAEFKFIHWQKKSNTIRQNSLFKDFYYLAESNKRKRKYLYLTDLDAPLRFLNGKRALESVMSKNNKLSDNFDSKYQKKFKVVNEYYLHKKNRVELIDITSLVPNFPQINL